MAAGFPLELNITRDFGASWGWIFELEGKAGVILRNFDFGQTGDATQWARHYVSIWVSVHQSASCHQPNQVLT